MAVVGRTKVHMRFQYKVKRGFYEKKKRINLQESTRGITHFNRQLNKFTQIKKKKLVLEYPGKTTVTKLGLPSWAITRKARWFKAGGRRNAVQF
jgi:hypothetical protein